jgi:prophage regulatory protein
MRRLMTIAQVVDATGQGRSTIYVLIREGAFPRPVRLGSKSVRWVEDEVSQWNDEQIAARDRDPQPVVRYSKTGAAA